MKVLTVDFNAPNAPLLFAQSIRETGFGVLINHPISFDLINQVYDEWKTFFTLDEEEKSKYLFKRDYDKVQDGYFPTKVAETAKGYNVKDLKEFYHAYPCRPLPNCIGTPTIKIREQLLGMGKTVLKWLDDSLPEDIRSQLSMPLIDMVDEEYQTLLRILHYPPLPEHVEEGAVRAAAHEDINLITLLVAATAPGLQVKDKNGKWLDVPCEPNAIIVNSGDVLKECTQGYYSSTTHQVVNPTGEAAKTSRYSIPLFLHAREEVRLSDRYIMKDFFRERLAELGLI